MPPFVALLEQPSSPAHVAGPFLRVACEGRWEAKVLVVVAVVWGPGEESATPGEPSCSAASMPASGLASAIFISLGRYSHQHPLTEGINKPISALQSECYLSLQCCDESSLAVFWCRPTPAATSLCCSTHVAASICHPTQLTSTKWPLGHAVLQKMAARPRGGRFK